DPELRHTASNTPVTTFTLAIDRNVRRTNDAAQQTADFIDIVAWDTKADFAAKWFRKGQLVAVCGRIQSRKWQDNNGNNRTSIEVIADELHFAESKRDSDSGYSGQNYGQNNYGGGYGQQQSAPRGNYSAPAAQPRPAIEADGFETLSDDSTELPF
ncbi:MAG: single-stranded DNA-binding protein, partial [Clostridia bacterium]|nr:single-stranded DNA-binding protein [Clostridia bacterium]